MEKFLLLVKRDKFVIYKPDRNYELQYVNGEPFFAYEINRLADAMQNLLNSLTEEYNLESWHDIDLLVLVNGDAVAEKLIKDFLITKEISRQENIRSVIPMLGKIYGHLERDKNLLIDLYGINYDGINYCKEKSQLVAGNFKLLAYTLKDADIINEL